MLDAVDADEEIGTITCGESNEPAKAKTNTRKDRTEHQEHDENCRC